MEKITANLALLSGIRNYTQTCLSFLKSYIPENERERQVAEALKNSLENSKRICENEVGKNEQDRT